MDFAPGTRLQGGGLPRLRLSRLVCLVLLSQVLRLAVVSTAHWEFKNDQSGLTDWIDEAAMQPPPEKLTGYATDDPVRLRPTLAPPRVLGEANQIVDCLTNVLRAYYGETSSAAADDQRIDCYCQGAPDPIQLPGQLPGQKPGQTPRDLDQTPGER